MRSRSEAEGCPVGNPRAPIFAAAGVLAVSILLVVLLVLPKIGQVSEAKDELAAAKAQQQSLETQKAALEDVKAKAAENRLAIEEVDHKIPPTAEEAGLILLIHNAAVDAGLNLLGLSPSPPVFDQTSGLSTLTVAMNAEGTYNEVVQFAFHVETLPRAAKITSLALSPTDRTDLGSPILTVTLQIDAYTSDTSAGPGSLPGPTGVGG
jgi:Tfp pilus assembly protein PilO